MALTQKEREGEKTPPRGIGTGATIVALLGLKWKIHTTSFRGSLQSVCDCEGTESLGKAMIDVRKNRYAKQK